MKKLSNSSRTSSAPWGYLVCALALIWLGPALACGSFAPRPTPTPTTPTLGQPNTGGPEPTPAPVDPTPLPVAPTATLPPAPTPTFTPTPAPGTALAVGQPARVTAPSGLNVRGAATTSSQLLGQLSTGQRVTVIDGPVEAEGFTWWQVEDGSGITGWVAERDAETVWLSPQVGEAQPVNRPPQIGDRVAVTMDPGQQLSLRSVASLDGPLITRLDPGQQFTVVAGPQNAGGFTWYQIRSDDGTLEGWAAAGNGNARWLSPLE